MVASLVIITILGLNKFILITSITICPGSSNPFYIVTHYINWGNYFLDTQYSVKLNAGLKIYVAGIGNIPKHSLFRILKLML